jgi:protease-4
MLYDFSKLFENEGIEAVPIDTGEFKSAGAMGTEITERQREDFQRIVDRYFDGFVEAIMRGRDMTEASVREVADGRMFVGQEGVDLGLVDGIQTLRETLSNLSAQRRQGNSRRAAARVRLG